MGDLHSDEQSADGRFHSQPFTTTYGGGEIPFRVIGRKYTEGTYSRSHAYNTLSVLYIEGEAWQEPLQEKQGYTV